MILINLLLIVNLFCIKIKPIDYDFNSLILLENSDIQIYGGN